MKCTTSCASAASNAASPNGSASADACADSTSGRRSRSASTNDADGSTAATFDGADAGDELGGQRARAAAHVEHALAGADAGEVRELRRERSSSSGP